MYVSNAMNSGDRLPREIREEVWSIDGVIAAVQATNRSEPAVCAVDALLREVMGETYTDDHGNEATCALMVRELMDHLGFVEAGQGKCPKTPGMLVGAIWRHPDA